MADARIRLVSAALLSVAAFVSLQGALAAGIWWLIFTGRQKSLRNQRVIGMMILLIAIVSALIFLSGKDGLSYFVRMCVIILIGAWLYAGQQHGDFLRTGVWCLGKKTGFTLGLIAEMGMLVAEGLSEDFTRIRIAQSLKGLRWGPDMILPTGIVLIHSALARAQDTTELLAVRGYRDGGSMCPHFAPTRSDLVAGTGAICVLFFAIVSVSEFFIL
jgi:energy-coupling factor transport system permease protein